MNDREIDDVADDGMDAEIKAAFGAVGERASGDDDLVLLRVSARITELARPALLALRSRPPSMEPERSWRLRPRFAAPLALAATLLIAFVVTEAPQTAQEQPGAEADTSSLLFNVMMKTVRADDAARTLAAGGTGATDLWTRIDD